MLKYFIGSVVIILLFIFKPISTYFIQDYASQLLKQKVKVSSLSLFALRVDAYISNSDNKISANIKSIYPLKVEAFYSGDIDAFKTYQPLKGYAEAQANILYNTKLLIDAQASLYGADAKITLRQLKENWFVKVGAKSLNLKTLQEQNNKEIKANAELDFELNLYTDVNASLNINTKAINVADTHIKNINLKLFQENEKFKLASSFKIADFEKIYVGADGLYKDANITASANIAFKNAKIDIDRLKINTKNLHTTLHTSSIGGNVDATYKNNMLHYAANNIELSKLLKFLGQKALAKGNISLKGKLDTRNINADIAVESAKITIKKQQIENIKLVVPDLKYKEKELLASYELNASILQKPFKFNGNISYKNNFNLYAHTNDFKGKTELHLDNKEIELKMSQLDLMELQKFVSLKPQATGFINIDAKGNFKKLNFLLTTDAKVKKHPLKLKADGLYILKSNLLESNFNISLPLTNDSFKVEGKASYQKHLKVQAKSSSFESKTDFFLEDKNFKFNTRNLNVHKLSSALNKPKILFGLINIEAKGNIKDISFKISSDELRRDMELRRINNSLLLDLKGHYTPKLLTLKNKLILNYKQEKIPLSLDARVELKSPYKAKGSLTHAKDKFIVNFFSYENEQIKSDFILDVEELYKYRALMSNSFHGPLKIDAKYTDALNIKTNSLGGKLKINLNKNNIYVKLQELNIEKITHLIDKDNMFESGRINGDATYDIKNKTAKTDIALSSALLNGIDIDKKISNFNDALGLNVINISKSLLSDFENESKIQTNIQQLQFNVSLKNKNINLDDVALKTANSRIVTLGSLKQNGDINSLAVSIVDKQGCAIITQALSGNIKNPKTAKTTSTLVNIVQRVPDSILNTGKEILDFSTKTIDGVASFGAKQVLRTDKKISITSDIVSKSSSLLKTTSNIVMPSGCKVIYDGEVKHPTKVQKEK